MLDREADDDRDLAGEERAIYVIMAVAVVPILIGALIHGGAFDGGETLALGVVVAAAVGLLARLLTRPSLPRARVHSSRSR